eukprot:UN09997
MTSNDEFILQFCLDRNSNVVVSIQYVENRTPMPAAIVIYICQCLST